MTTEKFINPAPPFIFMSEAVRKTLHHMLRLSGYSPERSMREWALEHCRSGRLGVDQVYHFRAAAEECGMRPWTECSMGEFANHPKFNTRNYAIK